LINQHEFKIHRKLPFLGWRLALPTSQSQLDLPETWFQKVLPILENEKKKKTQLASSPVSKDKILPQLEALDISS
jgi:hypothetical protein